MLLTSPPIVCVDTTAFFKSLQLTSAGWPAILTLSRRGQIDLVVPLVVVLEAERHYRRQVQEKRGEITSSINSLDRLGVSVDLDVCLLEQSVADRTAAYQELLSARLQEQNATVLPMPGVSHADVVRRDLEGRKPFGESGKGYRDALIWESLLEYLERAAGGTHVILVTNNSSDFCEARGKVSGALEAEIEAFGMGFSIERVATLPEAMDLLPDLAYLTDLARYEEPEETVSDVVRAAVIAAAESLVNEPVADPSLEHSTGDLSFVSVPPDELSEPSIEEIYVVEDSVDYSTYDELEGSTLLIRASIDAEITFEGWIDKRDYFVHDDSYSIIDPDWNDHTMHVSCSAEVTLWFELVVIGVGVENVTFDYGELR